MPKSKLSAAIYLVLVFLSGTLVGGFSYRLMTSPPVKAVGPRTPEEWRKRYTEEMRLKVNLDAGQVSQLQAILDGTKQQYDQLRQKYKAQHDEERAAMMAVQAQQVEKVRSMLRDDQRTAYDQFREERERRRQEGGDKKGGDKKGRPR